MRPHEVRYGMLRDEWITSPSSPPLAQQVAEATPVLVIRLGALATSQVARGQFGGDPRPSPRRRDHRVTRATYAIGSAAPPYSTTCGSTDAPAW